MNQSCQEFLLVVMQLSKGKMRKNNLKKPVSKTKNRRPDFRFPINISIVWLHKIMLVCAVGVQRVRAHWAHISKSQHVAALHWPGLSPERQGTITSFPFLNHYTV